MLRKISGPKRDQVTGAWRRLRKEKLYDMYCWPNIIQFERNEMGGTLGSYG